MVSPQLELEHEPEARSKAKDDVLRELEAYDRISKSLKTGLLGIRTAKQGIERLEDKVSHVPETKPTLQPSRPEPLEVSVCSTCQNHLDSRVAYLYVPVPRLWRHEPRFRFTLLGLIVLLFSLWYIAESALCYIYCKPDYCYPSEPCQWTHDDPTWGLSIPVKLDQWVTGGQARELAGRMMDDVLDVIADAWDSASGRLITQVDAADLDWGGKQQLKRRLLKRG